MSPNGTITITIKNQPSEPYTDKDGHIINTYYAIFHKGPDKTSWPSTPYCVYQSDTIYTRIILGYGQYPTSMGTNVGVFVADGALVDFRIQTVTGGYFIPGHEVTGIFPTYYAPVFEGEGSEIIEFTLDIPSMHDKTGVSKPDVPNIQSPSEPSTQTPSYPRLTIIILVTICIIVIPIIVIMYLRRQRKTKLFEDIGVVYGEEKAHG